MLDIMVARLKHLEWSNQLETALTRKRTLILDVRSHTECELGVWLYGDALREYAAIAEIGDLEVNHKAFHYAAEQVVKWHNAPKVSPQRDAQAQLDFEEAQRRSKDVVYLLTMLEYKLLKDYQENVEVSEKKLWSMLRHPLKTVDRLMNKSRRPENLSRASLEKLRQDLRDQK